MPCGIIQVAAFVAPRHYLRRRLSDDYPKLTVLVIPAINEVFGTHYDERTNCEQLRNEHLELSGRIITDSIFRLGENTNIYGDLMELSKSIAEYMLRKQKQTKKEVSAIMGGKVLELRSERIIRKVKQVGRAEGRVEGEGRLSPLMSLLLKGGKTKEAAAAAEDSEVRKRLSKEYGIA